jgi:mRNA interferase YafQ
LQYLSPLGWEHINLTGDYLWRSSAKIGAGKFRPLRRCNRLSVLYFPFSETTPIERTVSGVRCTNDDLKPVLVALATDQPLDVRYRDHDLSGDWAGYRECHIKPDLLLIYRKSDADTLRLARLGSHSELFG